MCILFSFDEYRASETLLIVSPLRTPPSKQQAWQLVYVNNLLPKRVNNVFGNAGLPQKAPPLMIVPIPNPHQMPEHDFTLFPVSNFDVTTLTFNARLILRNYFESPFLPDSPTFLGHREGFNTFGSSPKTALQFQQIGSYNLSVAPSLTDLRTRAPWHRFSIPEATASLLVDDVAKRFPKGYAFIIAEGTAGELRQSGFAVQYRDATQHACFFPTSHERTTMSSGLSGLVEMDVNLIALGAILKPLSLLPPGRYAPLRMIEEHNTLPGAHYNNNNNTNRSQLWRPATDNVVIRGDDSTCRGLREKKWQSVVDLVNALPTVGGGKLHGDKIVEHEAVRVVTAWTLKGLFPNRDVVARKANANDIRAVVRAYGDLGSWLYYRENKRLLTSGRSGFGTEGSLSDMRFRLAKVDTVLSLLSRQLAYPGLNDRVSNVANGMTGEFCVCGPVSYVNLDLAEIDLDESGYEGKDGYARYVKNKEGESVDTVGTMYVRVSAEVGEIESVEMRTVQGGKEEDSVKKESVLGGEFGIARYAN